MSLLKTTKFFMTLAVVLVFPLFFHQNSEAATLSLSPSTAALTAGKAYDMQILVNTEGVGIISADVRVNYDPTKVTIVSITPGPIFTNAVGSNQGISSNYLTISRAIPTDGTPYNGSNGVFATIRFTARETGTANFTIPFTTETTSQSILASGPNNLLTAVNNASYGISAEVLGTSNLPDTSIFDDLGAFSFIIGFLAILIGGNEIYQLKKKVDLIYKKS